MKILQVITSLETGGAERIVVELSMRLHQRGHEVGIVVFNGQNTPFMEEINTYNKNNDSHINVYTLGRSYYDLRNILKLRKILKSYDIIHTHNSSPQLYAALSNIGIGNILITTEHNTSNRKRKYFILSLIDKWMYKRYHKVICISQQALNNLVVYLRSSKDNIILIRNGIDVNKIYEAAALNLIDLPEQKDNIFVVLMVAAFRPQKDQGTLIDAISILPNNYHLWLAGEGACRKELETKVKEKNLQHRVLFLGNRSDIPQLLHSADVICLSTHYEGLSLSNIEGMSAGKPFVATDVDGIQEVTRHAGILVPHQDAQGLADVIRKLHDDKVYYKQVSDACYNRALHFDIGKMVDAYEQVYKELFDSYRA